MSALKLTLGVALVAVAMSAAPASAVVVTFATFSDPTTVDNIRFANSGNSSSVTRTTNGSLYSTNAAGAASQPIVRFSLTQQYISDYVDNVNALFSFSASVPRGDNAFANSSGINQPGISGTFAFTSTAPITVTGPHFYTHTYAAGSNLLSGTFTAASLVGSGSSAAISLSTLSGATIVYTSDFLNFTPTVSRDLSESITAIRPTLGIHAGINNAITSFRGVAGGQFSSDPAPLVNGLVVPEPGVWMLMVAGFGLVGVASRRRGRAVAA